MRDKSKEFERQVQEKLRDLRFTPTRPVWDKIEAQLPAGRRGHQGYLLWVTLLGAAMMGGYLFFYPNPDTDKTKSTLLVNASGNKQQKGTERNAETRWTDQAGKTSIEKNPAADHISDPANKPQNSSEEAALSRKKDAIETNDAREAETDKQQQRQYLSKEVPIIRKKDTKKGKTDEHTGNTAYNSIYFPERSIAAVIVTPSAPLYNKKANSINPPGKSLPFVVSETVTTTRKKWNLEPGANGGQSIFNDGNVNKMFTAARLSVLNNRTPSRGVALAAAPMKPSEVQPGKSIALGMDARYHLTGRVSFTAGLYYNLLTTKMKVGDKINQEVSVQQNGLYKKLDEYYNNGFTNDYINSYHFIELPLLLYVQLNRGKKLPLYMNGGVSFARLINTNALHYDGALNIYYTDKDLVKKNFVNVQSGLSARFFANNKISLLAGPEIQYGLTNLLKGKVENSDKHSLFIGLKVGMSF